MVVVLLVAVLLTVAAVTRLSPLPLFSLHLLLAACSLLLTPNSRLLSAPLIQQLS